MKKTEKLYYKDSEEREFQANILKSFKEKNHWVYVLDKTLFYPEGGGQPADKGSLNNSRIIDVRKKDDIIYHYSEDEIKTKTVMGKIDYSHRFDFMQQHSGQHLLSAAFWRIGKHKTVSVNMSKDYTSIEIDTASISNEELSDIEKLANDKILENLPIEYELTDDKNISKFNLRKPTNLTGNIRIVKIGDFDSIACGGVHLKTTGEIRLVKFIKTERIRGNIRVFWKIGNRAIEDYKSNSEIISELRVLLNSDAKHIIEKTNSLKIEINGLKAEKKKLTGKLINFYKKELIEHEEKINNKYFINKIWRDEDNKLLLELLKTLIASENRIICFINKIDNNFKWIIGVSENVEIDFNTLRKEILLPHNCKGGGKHPIWQGIGNTDIEFEKALKKFRDINKK